MTRTKSTLFGLVIVTAGLLSLYCAAAGWVSAELSGALQNNKASQPGAPIEFEGIKWVNEEAMRRYEAVKEAQEWFPWIVNMPQPVALMVTALAFGCLGGTLRVVFDCVQARRGAEAHDVAVLSLSSLMGLFVLGVSFVVPAALTVAEAPVRPAALLFFCSLGGAFYDHIFGWGREQIEKIFERRGS